MISNQFTHNSFLIFLHIQKTAGMTAQDYLRSRFGPSLPKRAAWRLLKNPKLSGNIKTAAKARTIKDGFFAGHFCFGMHRYLPKPATYMTFLRHPTSRLISLYHHSLEDSGSYYHHHAKGKSLAEFISASGLQEIDNGMTRFISGSPSDHFINRKPYGAMDCEDLKCAKKNLEEFFCFVGIQERFDESLLLLAHLLGDQKPRYLKLNVRNEKNKMRVSDTDILMIERVSELDLQLYEHAKKIFTHRLQTALPNIEESLAVFQEQNLKYNTRMGKLHNITTRIRPKAFKAG